MSKENHKRPLVTQSVHELITDQVIEQTHYVGPIPQAQELAQYQNIDKSFPDRIVSMAEKHTHSNTVEKDAHLKKAMNYIMVTVIIALGASIYFFAVGNLIAGGAFLSAPIITITISSLFKK